MMAQLMMPVMRSVTVPTMLVMQSGTVSTMLVMQFVTAQMIWMAMCRTTVITELTDKRVKQTEDVLLRLSLYKEKDWEKENAVQTMYRYT